MIKEFGETMESFNAGKIIEDAPRQERDKLKMTAARGSVRGFSGDHCKMLGSRGASGSDGLRAGSRLSC